MTFISTNIDEGSRWYFASYGDTFSPTTISNGDFVSFSLSNPNHTVDYGDFYLGMGTAGEGSDPRWEDDIFGWAKFRNSPSGLELLGSAVSYHTGGIIIGTTTVVPEPTTIALLTLGTIILRRRRA